MINSNIKGFLMAEEEKETQEEQAPAAEKKSGSMMLIIIIVVLILLIVVGGVVALLMMGGDENQNPQQQQQQQMQQNNNQGGNYPQSQNSGISTEIGPMYPLDTFTVNLLSESGRRYLKVEMNLEINGEELAMELDSKGAVIRDVIIRLLSSKSLEEISTAKGKDKLKSQIVDQLNMRMRDGRIKNVYFTDFVVQ